MTDPLLNPVQQRLVILVLAALLLAISLLGLWLCRRLRQAYDRLYRRQREETDVLLAHPDHRHVQAQHAPEPPPEVVVIPRELTAEKVPAAREVENVTNSTARAGSQGDPV